MGGFTAIIVTFILFISFISFIFSLASSKKDEFGNVTEVDEEADIDLDLD